MMGSYFWKGTAMQACHNHPAVFHVASGIGSLQNHILDSSADSKRNLQSALAFALQQCNKAIRLLTQAANSTTMSHGDPGVAFIVCVLFVCFEALYGDHGEALTHAYQGQRLLRSCEQFVSGWEGASVVDPQTARPVLAGLQLQAKCMLGPSSPKLSGWQTGLSPLPKLSTIRSLEHANKTLRVVYSNLLTYHQDYVTGHTLGTISYNVAQKQARFVPWLRQWESSFAEYLFKEAGGLSPDDMSRAKVLKATHLLAMILAQVDNAAGWDAWRPFENEFKAIIDLAAAVLDSQQFGHVSEFEGLHYFPCMSFGLWVNEPLFVCMSRCTNPEYRRQAAGLLNGIPRSARKGQVQEPPKKITAKSKSSNSSSGRASASSHDDEKPLCGPNAVGLDMGRLAPYFDRLSPPYEEPWH